MKQQDEIRKRIIEEALKTGIAPDFSQSYENKKYEGEKNGSEISESVINERNKDVRKNNLHEIKRRVKTIGNLLIIVSVFGFIASGIIALIIFSAGVFFQGNVPDTEIQYEGIVKYISIITIPMAIVSVMGMVAGIRLMAYKPWSRIYAILVSFVGLVVFPPVGFFIMWIVLDFLTGEEIIELFKSGGKRIIKETIDVENKDVDVEIEDVGEDVYGKE